MVMITVNIHQAKTNLSRYLNLVQKGKRVVLSKRNIPIAEIVPIKRLVPKRKLGQSEENFEVPKDFFQPLPKRILDSFDNPK